MCYASWMCFMCYEDYFWPWGHAWGGRSDLICMFYHCLMLLRAWWKVARNHIYAWFDPMVWRQWFSPSLGGFLDWIGEWKEWARGLILELTEGLRTIVTTLMCEWFRPRYDMLVLAVQILAGWHHGFRITYMVRSLLGYEHTLGPSP